MKEKLFIASRSMVSISHRALDSYEKRSPSMVRGTACATWEEARAALVSRYAQMEKNALRDLAHAQRGLEKARALKPPCPHP